MLYFTANLCFNFNFIQCYENLQRSTCSRPIDGTYPLTGTLKPQSSGPLYSNTVIGTLAADGWAVTFGTARRGLGGLAPRSVPSSLYQM